MENEILDDELNVANQSNDLSKFELIKFTVLYISLIYAIGYFMTKYVIGQHLSFMHLSMGALTYLGMCFAIGFVPYFIYRNVKKSSSIKKVPNWFKVVEVIFQSWSIGVIIFLLVKMLNKYI